MITFLLKGLLRDKNRSILPAIVVATGVFLTVLFHAWVTGIMGQSIEYNARFATGHVKIMTTGYEQNRDQVPNDLALMRVAELKDKLRNRYPGLEWAERIMFGGLIDAPDENGETRAQGPVKGFGIDLLSDNSKEIERFHVEQSLKKGRLPEKPGEILMSDEFLNNLEIRPGDQVTLISSTMFGAMAFYNFTVVGTVEFGTQAMDKGSIIVDINDVRQALDMQGATGELLGFFKDGDFSEEHANQIIQDFNEHFNDPKDEFSPVMISLRDQSQMAVMVDFADKMASFISFIFIFAMSLVLWNAGLLGGLRRYGEFGVRLAIGEEKHHLYRMLILESCLIGFFGSVVGTFIGLSVSYYLQVHGIDVGSMMKNATMMMPTVFRAKITGTSFYIGFIPGLGSTMIGSMLAGLGIFKRKTAQLFKELET